MGSFANPFLRISGSLPPLIPKPQPIGPEPGAIDAQGLSEATGGDALPQFPSSMPKVSLAKFDPQSASPQEVAMRPALAKLRSDEQKDIDPWGSPDNHPGFLGKLGHALSWATGGPGRRQMEESGLEKSLQEMLNSESKNTEQGAQTDEAEARTNALNNPKEPKDKPDTLQTDEGMLQYDPKTNTWSPIQVNGDTAMPFTKPMASQPDKFQHVAGTAGGKQMFASYDPRSGHFMDQQGNILTDFKPSDKAMQGVLGQYAPVRLLQGLLNTAYNDNPALLPLVGQLAKQIMGQYGVNPGQAQEVMGGTPEGQPQNETGGTIGLRMPEAPTGTTRTRGQFAGELIPTMEQASKEIDSLGDQLGPFMGRISDLVTGKIGAYGPKFSGLQTDMHNIATGWGRAHGNSEKVMEAFYNDLNSAKDPANLKEKLIHYVQQAKIYKGVGEGHPNQTNGEGNSADTVYDDKGVAHRYKGTGSRSDPANYEAVKK